MTEISRRRFLKATGKSSLAIIGLPAALSANDRAAIAPAIKRPVIDTHMHVWANDPQRYPFPHPYAKDFNVPENEGTLEMLIDDMDRHGGTHAVLVQVIYHGWDNTYVADCAKRYPKRLKAHALIATTASRRRGRHRRLRPFPSQRRCPLAPRVTSSARSDVSSATRRPVCTMMTRIVRSRRPSQVDVSGAATNASTSSRWRKSIALFSWRFCGMASTRWQSRAWAGSFIAT